MSIDVVSALPDGVEISQHLREKAAKRRLGKKKYAFFRLSLYGRSFYVPITNEVWETFALKDSDFHENDDETPEGKRVVRFECTRHGLDGFLRQLIDSIALQVRDDVLDGMEESVMAEVMDHVRGALRAPIRARIEAAADERLKKELPEGAPPKPLPPPPGTGDSLGPGGA